MNEKPLSQRIQEGLVLDLVSEIKTLEHRLVEFEKDAKTLEYLEGILHRQYPDAPTLSSEMLLRLYGSSIKLNDAESRLRTTSEFAVKFCDEQCEEGPGWGECESCGCGVFKIKAALDMEVES